MEDQRLEEAFNILNRPYPTSRALDDWSIYGEHVGNKLRGYSKKASSIVQHLINNLLFEADMGKYDANPYQLIQPSQHLFYQNSPSASTFSQHSFASSTPSHTPVPSLSTASDTPYYDIPYDSVVSPPTSNNIIIQSSEYMGSNVQENLGSTFV